MPRNRACRHFRRRRCLEQPGQGLGLDTGRRALHLPSLAKAPGAVAANSKLPGLFHARDEPYA